MGIVPLLFVVIMFLGVRGGNDLLDAVPTATYWQIENVKPALEQLESDAGPDKVPQNIDKPLKDLESSDFQTRDKAKKDLAAMGPSIVEQLKPSAASNDPEVAAVAADLIKGFSERGRARAIRRLMAIRTLGETREKAAEPLLQSLAGSKEPFVAEYAARSVAEIEGKAPEEQDRRAAIQQDMMLLPKNTGIFVQGTGAGTEKVSLARLVDQLAAAMDQPAGPPGMPQAAAPRVDKQQMLLALSRKVLSVVERVGNIRLDGMTVGVSEDIGPNGGWGMFIFRGKYDAPAVMDAMKELGAGAATQNAPAAQATGNAIANGVPRIDLDESSTVLFPSNDLFVLIESDKEADRSVAVDLLVTALKTGQGTFSQNAEMAALIGPLDTKSPVRGAAKINDAMRGASIFSGVDTLTLESAVKGEAISFAMKGHGSDPEKLKASVAELNQEIQQMMQMLQPEVMRNPSLQPVLDLIISLKAVAADKDATFTGELKKSILNSLLQEVGPEILSELDVRPSDMGVVPGGM